MNLSHHIPKALCPWCGHRLDGATGIDTDARPEVGDLSVCIRCGGLIEFGIGLVPQRGSDAMLAAEPLETRDIIRLAQLTVAAINYPKKTN